MRILIVTPLYPPDIAEPAPYVKELAQRIANDHEVTILAYGHIPEHIPHVRLITIPKHFPLIVRLFLCTIRLLLEGRKADVIYAQNGPSIELPCWIAIHVSPTPCFIRVGDTKAFMHAQAHREKRILFFKALQKAAGIFVHEEDVRILIQKERDGARPIRLSRPHVRPEILPFRPYPHESFKAYDTSWKKHIDELITAITQSPV